jgi:hypothetical protein
VLSRARVESAGVDPYPLKKLAHNGLAGRAQVRRVSHSFDVAPGGLCALSIILIRFNR